MCIRNTQYSSPGSNVDRGSNARVPATVTTWQFIVDAFPSAALSTKHVQRHRVKLRSSQRGLHKRPSFHEVNDAPLTLPNLLIDPSKLPARSAGLSLKCFAFRQSRHALPPRPGVDVFACIDTGVYTLPACPSVTKVLSLSALVRTAPLGTFNQHEPSIQSRWNLEGRPA